MQSDMDKEYIINAITAKINEFILEISENSKHHADFIQDNTNMVVFGAETALDIMKETILDLFDDVYNWNR